MIRTKLSEEKYVEDSASSEHIVNIVQEPTKIQNLVTNEKMEYITKIPQKNSLIFNHYRGRNLRQTNKP